MTIQRVEIIIDTIANEELHTILRDIEDIHYTAHRAISGKTPSGEVSEDDLSNAMSHDYYVLFMSDELLQKCLSRVVKIVRKYKGMIYSSPCKSWLP